MTPADYAAEMVACFPSCRSKAGGRNIPFAEIIEGTRSGRWAQQVSALRRLPYQSEAYEKEKARLPCFMLSGSTVTGGHKAIDIERHSGLLQIDVDGVGNVEAVAIRDRFGADPHFLASWLSPSGEGVKGAFRIPANVGTHRQAFEAVSAYIGERYGVEIDSKCSDVCRLCFVSHDPDLVFNGEAAEFPIQTATSTQPEAGFMKGGGQPQKSSSSSLHSESAFTSCILHNTHGLFQDFPALLPIYDRHVRQKLGKPARGLRNAALVELVAGTFCVVHPRFVLGFADAFHREQGDAFADYPHDQWMREAQAALEGCLSTFEKKRLGPHEAELYGKCEDALHSAAFRICHSLACCGTDPTTPPPEFFLSAFQLATRLGVLDMQAWRLMKALEKKGAVESLKTGTRRIHKQKAVATRWRWKLPLAIG